MSWVAVAVVGTAATVSAVSSAEAGKRQEDAANDAADQLRALDPSIEFGDPLFAFNNPNLGNAALAGLNAATLAQLGLSTSGSLAQGGPLGLLQNAAGAAGFTDEEFSSVSKDLGKIAAKYANLRRNGWSEQEARRRAVNQSGDAKSAATRMARLSGFARLSDFLEAQFQYETQAAEFEQRAAEIAPQIQQGRNDALLQIAQLQGDFPVVTAEGLRELELRETNRRFRELDENRDEAERQALEQSQAFGTNPAGVLGQIREQDLQSRQDIQDIEALQRAILLASGQQSLGAQGLAALQGSLNAPLAALGQGASLTSQGQNAQGSLALQQANVLNQINANLAIQETANRLGVSQDAIGLALQGDIARIQGTNQAIQSGAQGLGSIGGLVGGVSGGGAVPVSSGGGITSSGNRFSYGSDFAPATGR